MKSFILSDKEFPCTKNGHVVIRVTFLYAPLVQKKKKTCTLLQMFKQYSRANVQTLDVFEYNQTFL